MILPKKFDKPRRIGDNKRILVKLISSEKSVEAKPLKIIGIKYGTKKKANTLTAIINKKKKEKILSINFLPSS